MRILLVTMLPPWPTKDGARQRTNLLHRALSAHGRVDTVVISRTGEQPTADQRDELEQRFGLIGWLNGTRIGHERPWRMLAGLGRSWPDRAAHLLGGWGLDYRPGSAASAWMRQRVAATPYDLIVSRYLWPAAHAGLIGRHPLIVDVDDLESQRLATQAASSDWGAGKRRWWQRRVRQIAAAERRALSQVDHVWLTKPQDASAVPGGSSEGSSEGSCGGTSGGCWSLLPNVPFVPEGQEPAPLPPSDTDAEAGSPCLLFVGSLDYAINVRAVDRFIERVWPKVRRGCPGARFRIVGNRMAEADHQRWAAEPGVEPVGFVEEVREAYREATLTVVPIWEGAGTKIKVLESLMLGRAVVTSSDALRGYEQHLHHGQSVWVAGDDAAFAEGCLALLQDPASRDRLVQAGRAQVLAHYSPRSFRSRVAQTVARVLGAALGSGVGSSDQEAGAAGDGSPVATVSDQPGSLS